MVNLCTKFDIAMITHGEDTKGNAKCRNLGGLRLLGSPKVSGNVTIR